MTRVYLTRVGTRTLKSVPLRAFRAMTTDESAAHLVALDLDTALRRLAVAQASATPQATDPDQLTKDLRT